MAASTRHQLLSESACAWAMRYGFSAVAMDTESAGGSGTCDAVAVGVIRGVKRSAVFESKISRADFFADRKKWHRRLEAEWKRTHHRVTDEWYVTPAGLVTVDELPEEWGLLEADENGRLSVTHRAVVTTISDEAFREALALAAKACSQKYLTSRNCKWTRRFGGIELDPSVWQSLPDSPTKGVK